MPIPIRPIRGFPVDVAGEFETHVTVRTDDVDSLARWADEHGHALTHIVLARGRAVSQPMVTVRASATLAEVRGDADTIAAALRADGFAVTRVKIEVAPWHPGVPRTDAEAHALGPDRYFEHHLRLLLPADADLDAPAAALAPHGAHLSRNARRVRADGRHERFVTQRCRAVGDEGAARACAELAEALRDYDIASVEREFVVYDTNCALDEGWIESPR